MSITQRGPPGQKKYANKKASKVRASAQLEVCRLQISGVCNHNPETTVLCHIRAFGFAGVGQKPPDIFAVYGCSSCHAVLDDRSKWAEASLGWEDVLRAVFQTQLSLLDKGLIRYE